MARLRSEPGSRATTKSTTTRQALKEKTNTARVSIPVYEDDGNTENLVKDAKPKRGRPKRTAQPESDELVMAGGLGLASEEIAQQTSDMLLTTDELAKSDPATGLTAKSNRRPTRTLRKIATSQAQTKVLDGLKQRMNATARGERAKQRGAIESAAESSDPLPTKPTTALQIRDAVVEQPGFSLSPSPPPASKISSVQNKRTSMTQPGSVLKAKSTPAVESSILALKNFKRRPRQPSMLQMVKQRMGSARPSLANATTVGVDDNAVEDTSAFDLGLSDDAEEEDFAPEAEGTPLQASKTRTSILGSAKARSKAPSGSVDSSAKNLPRKRNSDGLDLSSVSLSALCTKKQRQNHDVSSGSLAALRARRQQPTSEITQAQDSPRGQEIIVQSSPERAETPQPPVTSDIQVVNSPSSSTPPTEPPSSHHQDRDLSNDDDYAVPSTEREAMTADAELATRHIAAEVNEDDVPDGTMADPASSPGPMSDDILANPATQLASRLPAKSKPKGKSKPMNTAALQSLLPKRRKRLEPRQRRSEYDMESSEPEGDETLDVSHLEDDEDELGSRARRPTKTHTVKSNKKTTANKGRPSKAAAAAAKRSHGNTGSTKMYGRATLSDKENDGYESFEEAEESTLPEISHSMQDVAKSKEIEVAKAKFADIDQWDMEFETMSADIHRSSSLDWR